MSKSDQSQDIYAAEEFKKHMEAIIILYPEAWRPWYPVSTCPFEDNGKCHYRNRLPHPRRNVWIRGSIAPFERVRGDLQSIPSSQYIGFANRVLETIVSPFSMNNTTSNTTPPSGSPDSDRLLLLVPEKFKNIAGSLRIIEEVEARSYTYYIDDSWKPEKTLRTLELLLVGPDGKVTDTILTKEVEVMGNDKLGANFDQQQYLKTVY
jgi:hypothetical protein